MPIPEISPPYDLSPALYKTVREIELERKVADLERALYRAKYGGADGIMLTPQTVEVTHNHGAPDYVKLPKAAYVETRKNPNLPHGLEVHAAIVRVPQPFGLHYFVDLGMLTQVNIGAQVLGMLHERFVHELAEFVRQETEGSRGLDNSNDKRTRR